MTAGATRGSRTGDSHRPYARPLARTGTWSGRPTAWHKTFANGCEFDAATGDVYRC
ncbi:hypothetical protein [Streptomyces sp. NPDC002402]